MCVTYVCTQYVTMFLSALFSVAEFHLCLCLISAKKTVRETEIDTDQIEKDLINKFYQ